MDIELYSKNKILDFITFFIILKAFLMFFYKFSYKNFKRKNFINISEKNKPLLINTYLRISIN